MADGIKPVRLEDLQVQGDGRPFSRAPRQSPAILKRKAIIELFDDLTLDPGTEAALAGTIAKVMGVYLGQKVLAKTKTDHAKVAKELRSIARKVEGAARSLDVLDNSYLLAIEAHQPKRADGTAREPFDFLHLVPTLRRLGAASTAAAAAHRPRPRARPSNDPLVQALESLLPALKRAKLELKLVNSGSADPARRRRIEGDGGALLEKIFARYYPGAQTSLFAAAEKARANCSRRARALPASRDIQPSIANGPI